MPDKRKRTRVNTGIEATVGCGSPDRYQVRVRNISLKGVLCDREPRLGAVGECEFVIHLSDALLIRINASMVRNDEGGMALDFVSMDETAFFHLRNLVRYHAPDPDAIDREMAAPAFTPEK